MTVQHRFYVFDIGATKKVKYSSLKNTNNNRFWNNKNIFFPISDIKKIKTILHSHISPFSVVKISSLSYECSLLGSFRRETLLLCFVRRRQHICDVLLIILVILPNTRWYVVTLYDTVSCGCEVIRFPFILISFGHCIYKEN